MLTSFTVLIIGMSNATSMSSNISPKSYCSCGLCTTPCAGREHLRGSDAIGCRTAVLVPTAIRGELLARFTCKCQMTQYDRGMRVRKAKAKTGTQ